MPYCMHKYKLLLQLTSDTIPRTVPFLLLILLLGGYSFANVHVKDIVAF